MENEKECKKKQNVINCILENPKKYDFIEEKNK